MRSIYLPNHLTRIVLTDILVLLAAFAIPAISHLTPFPLYLADPMRLLLFTGYLMSRNNGNALLLAGILPLVSTFLSGHPPFYKAILISFELMFNIGLYIALKDKINWPVAILLFLSIVASKIVYYFFKFWFIQWHLIEGQLVSTSFGIQLIVALVISIGFTYGFQKMSNQK